MFENKTEQQAKDEILKMVAEYCDTYHNKKEYHEGDNPLLQRHVATDIFLSDSGSSSIPD